MNMDNIPPCLGMGNRSRDMTLCGISAGLAGLGLIFGIIGGFVDGPGSYGSFSDSQFQQQFEDQVRQELENILDDFNF